MKGGGRLTMARLRIVLTALSLVAAFNCGGSSPSSPSAASFTGTWAGTANPDGATTGNLQLKMAQSSSQLTGTWTITFSSASQNNGGTLTGSVTNGSTMSVNLYSSVATDCPLTVSGTLSGTRNAVDGQA